MDKMGYESIKNWLRTESGLSDEQITTHSGLPDILEKFQDKIIAQKIAERQLVRHDMGHGMCQECKKNWAEEDYNGHGYYVCLDCYDSLNREFDEEYR